MGANLCLKNINDKHSPTKGINVLSSTYKCNFLGADNKQ